jgi:hypothetical protein
VAAKKFLFLFAIGCGGGSAHTFRSIILLIRIYSDFIPENHSKPAFFGCE